MIPEQNQDTTTGTKKWMQVKEWIPGKKRGCTLADQERVVGR